jgi:DNA mismatch repair protein MSH3
MTPPAKKQQSISAFFQKPAAPATPRTVPKLLKHVSPVPSNNNQEDADDPEGLFELPPAKRVRRETILENGSGTGQGEEDGEDEEDEEDRHDGKDREDGPLKSISANPRMNKTIPTAAALSPSSRTSKYIFSSSPLQENQNGVVKEDQDRARKDELHKRFVRKLGKPDSIAEIKRRNRTLINDGDGGDTGEVEEGEDGEDEEEAAPKPTAKGRGSTKKAGRSKLTPMEKQVIDIKSSHMDTLLVVEVGYKFRFFGEDARIAAKELSIVCIPGKYRFDEHPSEAHLDRFASASIPVHRLHVHVKRLVAAGHKVGVVRQLETAALKKAGDNRNAPFVRKLTNLYTKGTYVDDVEGMGQIGEAGSSPGPQNPATGFLLCMTEVNVKGYGNDEKVHVGVIAVQPATGDVIYDDFVDGFMRSEIETRLLHIAPCEFLIVGELSKATEKLVLHLSSSKTNVFGDKIRVERVGKDKTMAAVASSHVSNFYADKMGRGTSDDPKTAKVLDKILGLPENVMVCLSAMIHHMAEYGLEHIFDLTKYFQPFSARSHMLLNGNTLTSLEVYQNQTDRTVKGSLFWTLDRTQTKFGRRLLRKWVGRPLLDKAAIEERLTAVEELLDPGKTAPTEKLRRVLAKIRTDLEKSLIRIYYGKCTRPELLSVLQSLQMLASEFAHATSHASTGFNSTLIASAITSIPNILTEVVAYLDKINLHAAKSDDKYAFFRDDQETDDISEHKFGIASVEQDLDAFRTVAGEKLGKKHPVNYATVSGIEYLIEVENSSATIKIVPASWAKISGTKKLSRFHPPEVVKLIHERDQHKESLAAACDAAFQDLLKDISAKYQVFRDAVQSLAMLDCLLSLANVAAQPGYVRPSFTDNGVAKIEVQGGRHPMIEQLLLDAYVPNDIALSRDATRALLVTGPNMGGKSSYVRSVALIAIMAQIGSFVPAKSAKLGILDAVFTRMGAEDNMMQGESTFMVELGETSEILRSCTERSLVVLDELGRGTSTHDGVAIAGSVLDFLVREKGCLVAFITHYQVLSRMAEGYAVNGDGVPPLRNVHMRFTEDEGGERLTFLYEVGEGVAHRSYGLNVARLANVPEPVIVTAAKKSRELEGRMRGRRLGGVARLLVSGTADEIGDVDLEAIVEGIEQL